jgi:hypothetical protein
MSDRPTATPVSDSAIEESLTAIGPRQMTKRNKSVPDILHEVGLDAAATCATASRIGKHLSSQLGLAYARRR